MRDSGYLVLSLDFELIWGVFDKVSIDDKLEYFRNTKEVIPRIIDLFQRYDIHCTWATVGMLFNNSFKDWNSNFPNALPDYDNISLSAYRYGENIQHSNYGEICFAPQLIKLIAMAPNQEIGTHTYSHYYCNEPGQGCHEFKKDLEASVKQAQDYGIELKSLVFPRNQYNPDYLKICVDLGITSVRSNPDNWYWKNTEEDTITQKVFRTGDAYIGTYDKLYKLSEIEILENGLVSQKASRLLRPYSSNKFLNKLKISRIKNEMYKSAKDAKVYHLWWHPHNFGDQPNDNLKDLEELLIYFNELKEKFDYKSANMGEITHLVTKIR